MTTAIEKQETNMLLQKAKKPWSSGKTISWSIA
jgi:hypothetical protein